MGDSSGLNIKGGRGMEEKYTFQPPLYDKVKGGDEKKGRERG